MGVLTLALAARADPVALRGVELGPPTAALGTGGASAATRLGGPGGLLVAVDLGWDGLATGISAGWSGEIVPGAWRIDGGISGGLLALPYGPTAGVELTPWIGAGRVGPRAALELRLAIPAAAALGSVGPVRLPLSIELLGGPTIRRTRVTPRLAVAPVWTPGLDVALSVDAGVVVALCEKRD